MLELAWQAVHGPLLNRPMNSLYVDYVEYVDLESLSRF